MMRRWPVLIVGLVGCNNLLGIDQADLQPFDVDQDSFVDESDNCPSTANIDQSDTDGDGFGDACDGCPALPTAFNHDEDSDGHGDDCDVCPGIPEFQDDTDRDTVGDACDFIGSTGTLRRLFDPFIVAPADDWGVSDGATAPLKAIPLEEPGLVYRDIELVNSRSFSVAIGVRTTRPWQPGDRLAIVIHRIADDAPIATCMLSCETECAVLGGTFEAPMMLFSATPVPLTSLQITMGYSTYVAYGGWPIYGSSGCGLGGEPKHFAAFGVPEPAYVELIASPTIQLTYVDILQ